jgi:molybdopterin-guanine dinucleotide biosynthesis protein A
VNFSAVILAGGQSRRMGRDKAWLLVEGKPLIARQIALARKIGAAEVFISGRAGTDYRALECPVLVDRVENAGPLAGTEAALAASSTPLLLVLAVDLANMTAPVLQLLAAACTPTCGAVPRVAGQIEPLAAFYPRTALEIARAQLDTGSYAVRDFAARCVELNLARFVDLPAHHAANFANWNTPADQTSPLAPSS